jgi:hypothetical protein
MSSIRLGRVTIVSVLSAGDDPDLLDAHLAFHLNAGVDRVVAIDPGSDGEISELLASYAREGVLDRLDERDGGAVRTQLARRAVAEHGADWVISSDADEFWWPRGESLQDVLSAIPTRYGVVQCLVRVFPPRVGEGGFADRLMVRPSLLGEAHAHEPVTSLLRPVYRGDTALVVDPQDPTEDGRLVPLRAWYPIEVLRFPFRTVEQAERFCARGVRPRSALEADACRAYEEGRLGEWYAEESAQNDSLVPDERLRNALRTLARPQAGLPASAFTLPLEGGGALMLRPPTIVDDAAYAGECAAVGEVDLVALDRHIRDLEARIGALEARFWPRVMRRLSRLTRR